MGLVGLLLAPAKEGYSASFQCGRNLDLTGCPLNLGAL